MSKNHDDVVKAETRMVSCDGSKNGQGPDHPLVYLTIGDEGHVDCPYCSRRFVFNGGVNIIGEPW